MKTITTFLILSLLLLACKKTKGTENLNADPYAAHKAELKTTYADLAFAVYDDSYIGTVALKAAIDNFVTNKDAASFQLAKDAWIAAREPYGQSEVFRFAGGPIDGYESRINSSQINEVYIDYAIDSATGGIINDVIAYPVIDESVILAANKKNGDHNITVGFHVIEFLLWGQDLSSASAGLRPFTDYKTGGTASNQDRRRAYLKAVAAILVSDMKQVRDAWDPTISGSYRSTFLAMDTETSTKIMFNSIRELSEELASTRIKVPYQSADQEDEHSVFSDNTHRDIATNAQGIYNLYNGTYTRVNGISVTGYSIQDLANTVSSSRNTALMTRFQATTEAINAMTPPFDQAIIIPAERIKVQDVLTSLYAEQGLLIEIAADFGISF